MTTRLVTCRPRWTPTPSFRDSGQVPNLRSNLLGHWESTVGTTSPSLPLLSMKNREVTPPPDQLGWYDGRQSLTAPDIEAFGDGQLVERAMIPRLCTQSTRTAVQGDCVWIVNNVSAVTMMSAPAGRGVRLCERTKLCATMPDGGSLQFGVNILGVYLDVCNAGTQGDIPINRITARTPADDTSTCPRCRRHPRPRDPCRMGGVLQQGPLSTDDTQMLFSCVPLLL